MDDAGNTGFNGGAQEVQEEHTTVQTVGQKNSQQMPRS